MLIVERITITLGTLLHLIRRIELTGIVFHLPLSLAGIIMDSLFCLDVLCFSMSQNLLSFGYSRLGWHQSLKTPSTMEKQAANLYTKKIFLKFLKELVETLAYPANVIDDTGLEVTYRVAKFGEYQKAHFLKLNGFRKKGSCSCQMFEFSGIISIKFVEEGTESMHAFDAALDAIHEGRLLEKQIEELNSEVEQASQRCEGYRTKLMAVLKDMEEQKLKLSEGSECEAYSEGLKAKYYYYEGTR
ncbi:hypothetical protein F3Y22_tig00111392pilonHSYRG00676 [Hibiscus syriacus]|uniref:Protein FAR1-RELATED SEQUENCE n=1 Tax=Hibiscus syriacus TaxID=106335 RepID=A0A6A2YLY0_HIBSY|nr:hypothetical protein F3Y22_tig00111392pilonHSYRG00676 [Hibiscus syriacus]